MDEERFDLVVVGSGPAGEKGAAVAAYHGKRVALVERSPSVGGTAVNTGGIPTKSLRETALQLSGGRRDDGLTVELDALALFDRLRARAGAVSASMCEVVSERLVHAGVEVVHGHARLTADHTVVVSHDNHGDRTLRAGVVLLAPGSRPLRPAAIPFDGRTVLDANEILALDEPFESIVIVGAGAVGCEYASIFASIGIRVWLVDVADHLLPLLDAEVSALLASSLRAAGVDLVLATSVAEVRHDDGGDGLHVELVDGAVLRPQRLLFAAGRASNVEGLGLDEAGVAVDARHRIVVDDRYETTAAGVFAAGDVIGPPALASVSMEQARVAMRHAFGLAMPEAVDELLPIGIYTIPEVAAVGMTEAQAAAEGVDHEVGRAWFQRNTKSLVAGDTEGLLKLVFERAGGRLLGVHILGAEAAELVHIGQSVVRHGGAITEFIQTTFNVPTRSDAYKYAAYDGIKRMEARAAFGDVVT
ncbi:MAG: Si-specific NAD(P)(+) transhydrogenase [Acidimicrobiales bacterium]